MSIEAINIVLKFDLPPTIKWIAALLANFADKQGVSWYSIGALSRISGLSRSTVISHLKYLETHGLIQKEKRSDGQTNVYKLDFSTSQIALLPSKATVLGSATTALGSPMAILPPSAVVALPQCNGWTTPSAVVAPNTSYETTEKQKEEDITQHASDDAAEAPSLIDQKKIKSDLTPYQKIIDLYHERLPSNPKFRELTKNRRAHMRSRWQEHPHLEMWEEFFDLVAESRFLTGKIGGGDGRAPFRATLDWLIKPENWAKVTEEKYSDRQTK